MDIFFVSSPDGGESWPNPEIRIDTDAEGAAISAGQKMACSGDNVYIQIS